MGKWKRYKKEKRHQYRISKYITTGGNPAFVLIEGDGLLGDPRIWWVSHRRYFKSFEARDKAAKRLGERLGK